MDQQLIKELIELVHSTDVGEVKIEQGNFKLTIRRKDYHKKTAVQVAAPALPAVSPAPVAQVPVTAPVVAEVPKAEAESAPSPAPAAANNYVTVKSPMIGTFYRSSSPDKEPFVKVGDKVAKGSPLCIIEAMKLFNEIESEVAGTIVKVLVDNASPIEYDQPLFLIDPQ